MTSLIYDQISISSEEIYLMSRTNGGQRLVTLWTRCDVIIDYHHLKRFASDLDLQERGHEQVGRLDIWLKRKLIYELYCELVKF